MVKKITLLAVEILLIVFLGVLLVIVLTGGFSLVLGPLKIKAHNFRNPIIIFGSLLLLRRFLAGSFFHDWFCAAGLKHLWTSGAFSFWRNISPLSRRLMLFFLVTGFAVNIFLSFFSPRTTLYFTRYFLTSPMHERSDSWRNMQTALAYFQQHPDSSLYAEVFFNQRVKFQYPPTSLLLLLPFDYFAGEQAIAVVNFISWMGILITIGVIFRLFSSAMQRYCAEAHAPVAEKMTRLLLTVCFTLTFYPVVRAFQAGQIQAWIYCCFVFALGAWLTDRKLLAGVFIGIISIIKPQLGLFLFWGAIRKQWRFVSGIALTAGIFGLLSLWIFGLTNHLDYLQVLTYMSKHGESYYPNQSVNGLLNHLLRNGSNIKWDGFSFAPYHPVVYAGTLLTSVLLIAAAMFWKYRQHAQAATVDFLIAALSFTIASPIAWEHHYNVMFPMFATALPMTLAARRGLRGMLLLATSFALSCNFYAITNRLADTWLNFFQSYLLFGAILLLFLLYRLRSCFKSPYL